MERQKNELREKELAADAEQRAADAEQIALRKAELIMQERLEREKTEKQERLEGQKLAFEVENTNVKLA